MVDADPLWIHLNEAAKFYDDDCFSATAVNYHFSWAGYYYLRQDWERCFPEFERTLAAFKGTQPMYEIEIRRIMGDAYVDAGRYEEAARTYKTTNRDNPTTATCKKRFSPNSLSSKAFRIR